METISNTFLAPFTSTDVTYLRDTVSHDELETLIRIHQAEIYRYVRYLGAADQNLAEDLVQETFLAAWRSSRGPDVNEDRRQAAWLRGIARNLFLAECRRKKLALLDEYQLGQAEKIWADEFLREGDGFDYVQALRRCLDRLAARQRNYLDLRYTQGKSRTEMARLLHMSEDGIKSALQRIRALLADCIAQRLRAEEMP